MMKLTSFGLIAFLSFFNCGSSSISSSSVFYFDDWPIIKLPEFGSDLS